RTLPRTATPGRIVRHRKKSAAGPPIVTCGDTPILEGVSDVVSTTRLVARSARLWRILGDVRAGEGRRVSLFGLQIFLLLTAYYLLKTVREPLILLWGIWGLGGQELKVYATSAQALLLLG